MASGRACCKASSIFPHEQQLLAVTNCLMVVSLLIMLQAVAGLSNSSSSAATKLCFPPDQLALQEFAASFNSSLNSTSYFAYSWRPQLDCCSWVGVTCATTSKSYSRVVGLSFGIPDVSSGLEGLLPQALCRLSALTSLELSYPSKIFPDDFPGKISGPIPSCIGHNLTNLQHLLLQNIVLGYIPPSFSRLIRLQTLDLGENRLSGSISPIISLPHLTLLNLAYNLYTGTLPSFNTPNLQYLYLNANFFSGPIPPFNSSPELEHLYLNFNSFSGPIPSFNFTPKLQILQLSFNELLTGDVFPSLPHLTHLEEVSLDETSVISPSASSISSLFCLAALQYLSISGSYFSRQYYSQEGATSHVITLNDPRLYCERPSINLTYLDLSSNHLTGAFPPWIGLFSKLDSLVLSANRFSGPIPQEWQSLTQLNTLRLSGDSPSTPHPIPSWLFRLPLLGFLTLSSMGLTTRDFPCELGLSLMNQTLQVLDLSNNQLSPGLPLWHCLAHHNFTTLSFVNLSNNPLAFSLTHYRPLAHVLDTLDLSFCKLSGNITLEILSSAKELHLAHNNLASSIPSQISSLGQNLVWLDLSFNNLTGPIPTSMGNLSAVNAIVLNNNNLHGDIPTQQLGSNFTQFGILNLANNYFTKVLFRNTHLFSLVFLDLSFNELEGDLQELFGDYSALTNLKLLILNHNQLTGSIPTSLGRSAPFLTNIELSNNNLKGTIPESLKVLPGKPLHDDSQGAGKEFYYWVALDYIGSKRFSTFKIDLSSNMLSGSIPQALGELLYLKDLNLSRNLLSGAIPSRLSNLTQLESLDLSYNKLQGSIPKAFAQLSALRVFNVSFNPELIGQIPNGPQLENLDSYNGDPNLCGYQVNKACNNSTSVGNQQPHIIDRDKKVRRISFMLEWIEDWASLPGICLGYAIGLGVTVWVLKLLNFYHEPALLV